MAATEEAAQEIRRFLDAHQDGAALNAISTIEDLNSLIKGSGSSLSGALIPLEQAQRPPKILDRGVCLFDWRAHHARHYKETRALGEAATW